MHTKKTCPLPLKRLFENGRRGIKRQRVIIAERFRRSLGGELQLRHQLRLGRRVVIAERFRRSLGGKLQLRHQLRLRWRDVSLGGRQGQQSSSGGDFFFGGGSLDGGGRRLANTLRFKTM